MIDDIKDVEEVIEDIKFEEHEKKLFQKNNFSKDEREAYELGLQTLELERNPYDEKTDKKLYDAFNVGWHFGK